MELAWETGKLAFPICDLERLDDLERLHGTLPGSLWPVAGEPHATAPPVLGVRCRWARGQEARELCLLLPSLPDPRTITGSQAGLSISLGLENSLK